MQVERRDVAGREVEGTRLRLTRPGGQVDPAVAQYGRSSLELEQDPASEPLAPELGMGPDPLHLCRLVVVASDGAAGDRLATAQDDDEVPVGSFEVTDRDLRQLRVGRRQPVTRAVLDDEVLEERRRDLVVG